jgi:hypothetical protein
MVKQAEPTDGARLTRIGARHFPPAPGHLTPRVPDDVPASIDATVRGELGLVVLRRRGLGWVAAPFGVGCDRELPLLPDGLPQTVLSGCDASGTTS